MTITRVVVRQISSADDETARAEDGSDVSDSAGGNENSDLDEDCDVDAADLAQLMSNWT